MSVEIDGNDSGGNRIPLILWVLVFETSASIDVAIKTGGVLGGFSIFCSAKNTLNFNGVQRLIASVAFTALQQTINYLFPRRNFF
jgi:hypothetical protein